ncbi:MAG: pyrroline-5-carboxylate reductase [Lachnospiraceae bacterium]|nr:pyrroline-5-carboxylate reductase [Lachnospiraceae bacterium]
MERFGFIGMGNMAKALAAGFIWGDALKKEQVFAYAPNQEKLKENAKNIGFTPMASLKELSDTCDTLIMACKPYQVEEVLSQIDLKGKVLLSVASGWDHARYKALLPDTRIQFIMPNTPAFVAEGIFLFEETGSLTGDELMQAKEIFETLGLVQDMPTHLMDIGAAICGCAPAFVDVMMEAYADSAVKYGIQRDTAYRLIGQMVYGSAKLMLHTGLHPGVLKDQVCSPGGTTIRGVEALEANGFRHACEESVNAVMSVKQNESK